MSDLEPKDSDATHNEQPQSTTEVGVEFNHSYLITNSDTRLTARNAVENQCQLGLGTNHLQLDRKHNLDYLDLGTPPKRAKETLVFSNKNTEHRDIGYPNGINTIIPNPSDPFKTHLGNLNEPWIATQAGHSANPHHNDFLLCNHTVTNHNHTENLKCNSTGPIFNEDQEFAKNFNHTVTNQNIRTFQTDKVCSFFPINDAITDVNYPIATTQNKESSASNTTLRDILGHNKCNDLVNHIGGITENHVREYDESTFQQLISIFPDADEDFIRKQCSQHSQINSIIDEILEMSTYPKKSLRHVISSPHNGGSNICKASQNLASPCSSLSITHQNQFEFLLQIFPDADPKFLETKSKLNDTDLKLFVSDALETTNYPKIKKPSTSETKEDPADDLGLYTTSFDIEKFLRIVKNPFTYYLDADRNCQLNSHSVEFLKRR